MPKKHLISQKVRQFLLAFSSPLELRSWARIYIEGPRYVQWLPVCGEVADEGGGGRVRDATRPRVGLGPREEARM